MTKVRIYAAGGLRVESECSGPNWFGGCPLSNADRPVACAGRKIAFHATSGRVVLEVEPDALSCPVAALTSRRPRRHKPG